MAAAAAVAFTATAAAAFAAVVMTVVVAVTAAATVFTVIVMMVVRAVNVAMSQFFFRCFTDSHNFYAELQVLASQHVVAVNHNVVVFNFGDFNRNRTLVGFRQEAHTNLQFVNAHEDVFRNALHQVFVVLTVSVVRANSDRLTTRSFATFMISPEHGNILVAQIVAEFYTRVPISLKKDSTDRYSG